MFGRDKVAMIVAEFMGTFVLASVVLTMVRTTPFPFFAGVAAGSTLGLMTLLIGSVSGAHINPAITLGLWTQRKINLSRTVVYVVAQMLGGLVAWTLAEYLLKTQLKDLAGDKFEIRILVAEAVGAFVFAFGVAAALAQGYKGLKAAATIGGSLSLGIFIAALASNGVLNPAVALGIQSWSYAYFLGPIIGSVLGMSVYSLLFAPRPLRVRAKEAVAAKTKALKKTVKKTTKKVTKKKR